MRGYYNQNYYGNVITSFNLEIKAAFLLKYVPEIGSMLGNITWFFADAGNIWNSIYDIKAKELLLDYGFSIKIPLRTNLSSFSGSNPLSILAKLGITSINFDFPLYVSNPVAGEKKFKFRWLFGFQSPF